MFGPGAEGGDATSESGDLYGCVAVRGCAVAELTAIVSSPALSGAGGEQCAGVVVATRDRALGQHIGVVGGSFVRVGGHRTRNRPHKRRNQQQQDHPGERMSVLSIHEDSS